MGEVWTMMSTTLGAPLKADEVFVWDYVDKYDRARSWKGTPKDFFKNCTTTRGSYVVCVCLGLGYSETESSSSPLIPSLSSTIRVTIMASSIPSRLWGTCGADDQYSVSDDGDRFLRHESRTLT